MLNKDNLVTRINILADANVISGDVADFGRNVVGQLDDSFSDDMCEMFITHLVMALNRVRNSEPVETLDPAIYESVTQNENFNQACKNYENLMAGCPYELPEQEKQFLLMHLTNLLENR